MRETVIPATNPVPVTVTDTVERGAPHDGEIDVIVVASAALAMIRRTQSKCWGSKAQLAANVKMRPLQ
jgi:hypothetical protein